MKKALYVSTVVSYYLQRIGSACLSPFSEVKFHDVSKLRMILDWAENPENSEEDKIIFRTFYARSTIAGVGSALRNKFKQETLEAYRQEAKRYQKEFLRASWVPLSLKILYCCELYLPAPLARFSSHVNMFRKKIKRALLKKKRTIVPYW